MATESLLSLHYWWLLRIPNLGPRLPKCVWFRLRNSFYWNRAVLRLSSKVLHMDCTSDPRIHEAKPEHLDDAAVVALRDMVSKPGFSHKVSSLFPFYFLYGSERFTASFHQLDRILGVLARGKIPGDCFCSFVRPTMLWFYPTKLRLVARWTGSFGNEMPV